MPNLDREILEFAKKQAYLNLMEEGIDVNFINPIVDRLNTAVSSGENINDLIDELESLMVSTVESKGLLQRYISQVASDSIIEFNALHTQTLVQGTGIEFYYYDGTRIAKTRPFCSKHQQKYYHFKEVQLLGDGREIDGTSLNANQLRGRKTGTNKFTIFQYRGGWNCRHQFAPVSNFSVPNDVMKRAVSKGYIKLNAKQKKAFGL